MTALLRTLLAVTAAALATPAFASEPAASADDQSQHSAAPKGSFYEVIGHDDRHHKFVEIIDLSKPADEAKLAEWLKHGHVHEIVKKQSPGILEMASITADLGIYSLIIFLLLLFILSKVAWPKMIAGLQKREENIRSALDEAEKARSDAQAIRTALQKDMDEAHLKVKALIDEGKRDAEVTAKGIREQAHTDAAADRERMLREVQSATDQALQTIWGKAAELATEASSKALRRSLDGDGHRRLIDEALAELKQSASHA